MKKDKQLKQTNVSWFFLFSVILVYIILALINFDLFASSLELFLNLITKIFPILIVVLILMIITNYFITPAIVTKYFNAPGVKKWLFVVMGGILSTGPIYMWYPLLAELKKKGVNYGFIATFLYSRAIKIPLWPIIIFYFNAKYVITLTIIMVVVSIAQGIIVNKILPLKQLNGQYA